MTAKVSNVTGQANPANIPQFNWRQLAAFILLPVAWWFILLYGITPLLLPAFSTPNGEPNAWLYLSIASLGYLFEFCLALSYLSCTVSLANGPGWPVGVVYGWLDLYAKENLK